MPDRMAAIALIAAAATSVALFLLPLLGLFGNDDENPDPAQVDQIEAELKAQGKQYEFHRYDGAGHAFFNYAAGRYQLEQATDGWEKVFAFFDKHLR